MMFKTIINFELKYWLRNFSFYIYLIFLFLFAALAMAGSAGIFGEGSTGKSIADSPVSLYSFTVFFYKILLCLLPAIIGYSVFKDYKYKVRDILFSFPVSKASYLSGKFFSSFLIVLILAFFMMLGLIAGTLIPGVDKSLLTSFNPFVYIHLYFVYFFPNILITGIIVFGIVIFTKNFYAGFISVAVIFVAREIIQRLSGGIDNFVYASLTDPFGITGTDYLLKNLTLAEINVAPVPADTIIILNRIIWLSIAVIFAFVIYRKFEFKELSRFRLPEFGFIKSKRNNEKIINPISETAEVSYRYDLFQKIKTSIYLALKDLKFIVTGGSFIVILISGLLLISVLILKTDPQTHTKLLPVTYRILGIPVFFFSFVILGLTFLYSGILINRPKSSGAESLINATPFPNSVFYCSKLLAIVLMQIILLILIMLTGIGIQIYSGYYNLNLGLYLFDLFVINLSGLIIWAIAALFIQSIVNNTFSGLFILILLGFATGNLDYLGVETPVLMFNKNPDAEMIFNYSDLNGYGHSITPFSIYKIYWSIFALMLCFLTIAVWQRKITQSIRERLLLIRKQFKGSVAYIMIFLSLIFIICGLMLYNEENKPDNKQYSEKENEKNLIKFKEKFSKFENIQQPRIESVFANINIFPDDKNFDAEGSYLLVNKTNYPVDTLLVKTGYDEITILDFPEEVVKIFEDSIFNFTVYKLGKEILPQDSLRLNFKIKNKPNTLLTQNSNVLKNGSYIKQDIFPELGYFTDIERQMPEDSLALKNHYQSKDSDVIDLEIIVSTSINQTAIAPGLLQKEWIDNGRKYFHYKPEGKIKFVLGILSGKYDFVSENHNGKEIGVYYSKEHYHNIANMLKGLKSSLEYNTEHFGEYQHSQAFIIEFPISEGTYATTTANIIPTSEIRFITDPENAGLDNIDISFYVAAHELTHQWWGNQVIPADVKGAHFITESVTEYITAKIYEKTYGKSSALKFLNIQMDRYLNGRAEESGTEMPLIYVTPEQSYISYGKGAVAFYTLSEYIGEDNLNKALKEYLDNVMYKGQPYTNSLELLTYIYKNTPDSLHYLISDLFESTNPEIIKKHFNSLKIN